MGVEFRRDCNMPVVACCYRANTVNNPLEQGMRTET